MKTYINFMLRTVFMKKGTYITALLTYLIICLQFYLMPMVLKVPINILTTQVVSFLFMVLALIIQTSIIAVSIFRTGIDDGTEILIVSKAISRQKIVLSKLIVLLIWSLVNSIISGIIPSFLYFSRYGSSDPLPYALGVFVLSFIISIFFGAITILACLGLKKNSAALTSIGIGTVLCVINMINVTTFNGPGVYSKNKENFTLNQVKIEKNNKNTLSNLNSSYTTVTFLKRFGTYLSTKELDKLRTQYNATSNEDLIPKIYEESLKQSHAKSVFYYDPILQWLQLINLANFYVDKNNSPMSHLYSSEAFNERRPSNAYLKFSKISQEEKSTWNTINVTFTNSNNATSKIELATFINSLISFKLNSSSSSSNKLVFPSPTPTKTLIIPTIRMNQDGTFNTTMDLKIFNVEDCMQSNNTSLKNELFKSIHSFENQFNNYLNTYKDFSELTNNNLYTFVLNYYVASLNIALNNWYVNKPENSKVNISYYANKPNNISSLVPWPIQNLPLTYKQIYDFLKRTNLLDQIIPKSIDLNNLEKVLNPTKNPNSPLISTSGFFDIENKDILMLGAQVVFSNFSNIQKILLDELKDPTTGKYNDVPYNNQNLKYFSVANNSVNKLYIANIKSMEEINKLALIQNPSLQDKFLVNNLYKKYQLEYDNLGYGLLPIEYLSTAIDFSVHRFLNLGWFITFWVILSILFLFFASLIYLKKDFK